MAHDHSHTHSHDDGHGHDHGAHDHHDHAAHASQSRLAIAGFLTAGFMLAEIVGGVISGSLALLADAAHMFTDAASLFLAWFGFVLAKRPADDKRSFGFARFRILAAFANGLTLVLLAGWIIVEAVQRFFAPGEIASGLMMWVAVAGLVVNVIAFFVLHAGDADHDDVNMQGALWHVAGDMLGSIVAIIAAAVIMWTGWMPIDPLLSIFVALLVGWGGLRVLRRSGHILLEGTPEGLDTEALARDLEAHVDGIENIHHVHVWTLTGADRMVTLHARMADLADSQIVRRAVRNRLTQHHGATHVTLEIDADGPDGDDCCDCLPAADAVHAH